MAFAPPPSAKWLIIFIYFSLKSRKRILTIFPSPQFWTKKAIFLSKYFKKSVKDCEFSVRQLKTIQ